jgi:hypothetical protein
MSSIATLLFGLLFLAGCVNGRLAVQTAVVSPPLPDSTMVAQLSKADLRFIHGQKVASVSYMRGDYYIPWTNDQAADFLRRMALQHGANLVKITYYQPGTRYARPELSADLYRVADARDYVDEDVIEWSADRKLSFSDFKYHRRIYRDTSKVLSHASYDFDIVARFHRDDSWIDDTPEDVTAALLHEQGDFDLCELYCRQYLEHLRVFNMYLAPIKGVFTAWKAKRAQYESETDGGLDHARQAEWSARINRALVNGLGRADPDFGVH